MLTKKQKGDIGLTQAIADFTKNKIAVSIPISEHLKYDLIAELDGQLKRIQVRYSKLNEGSFISVKLKSVWSNQKGVHVTNRKKGDYDVLAIYCPDTDEMYYVKDEEFDASCALQLRLTSDDVVKRNKSRVRVASNYKDCRRIFGWSGFPLVRDA